MTYELKTNTVVDALNEIHQNLNEDSDQPVMNADNVVEALNNICIDLGGEGMHLYAPDAIREIGENLGGGGSDLKTAQVTITGLGYNSVLATWPRITDNTIKAMGAVTDGVYTVPVASIEAEFHPESNINKWSVTSGDAIKVLGSIYISGDCTLTYTP